MNAERLHAIAVQIAAELETTKTPNLVRALAEAIDRETQEEASRVRQELEAALDGAPSNLFSPAWRLTIEELGVSDVLGSTLRERVDEIFARNEITAAVAAIELTEIAGRLGGLEENLGNLLVGLDYFQIGTETLGPGEFEIGFLIPREAVDDELETLGREFIQLERILRPFLELSIGSRPSIEIRSISSSAFQVFLYSLPATALVLAKTIESVVTSYEKIVNIRRSNAEMRNDGVPDELLDQISEHASGRMEADIVEIVEGLVSDLDEKDQARANELRKELRMSVAAIANRIDRGYSVEVRAGELPEVDEDEENAAEDADAATREAVKVIAEKQSALRFMNLSGKPILELPETFPDDYSSSAGPPAGDPAPSD